MPAHIQVTRDQGEEEHRWYQLNIWLVGFACKQLLKNFPNKNLFVVESVLSRGAQLRRTDMPEVKVYTTDWSADCDEAKRFLDDEGIFYEEVDIEESVEGARIVEHANSGKRIVPTFDIDGTIFSLKPFDWKKLQAELERLGVEEE